MAERFEIGMLWMQGALSFLEQLCIRSFQDAGHHVALYHYGEVTNVPEGVEMRDANLVVPERAEITHTKSGSPAPHADMFRYRLLAGQDRMIWADTDAYCVKPFRTETGHFYGWESPHEVNIGVLGLPKDSETLAKLIDFTSDEYAIPYFLAPDYVAELEAARDRGEPVHVGDQVWAVWGPKAFTHFLKETGEIVHAMPEVALYPYRFRDRRRMLWAGRDHSEVITKETYSIHLYGRRMRKRMAHHDKGLPHPESLMGQLLQRHGIDPCDAPLPDWPEPDRNHDFAKIYRTPPKPSAAVPDVEVRPLDKVVAVTTMKNEAPYILDWVAYHLWVGITHFLVYTNDCSDQTNEILDALSARGLVTRVDNPVQPGERPQRVALAMAEKHPRVTEADAYVVMDVDEYMTIHTGQGQLRDLFDACYDPDMISMTWRFFGHDNVHDMVDQPVPLQFTRAAPEMARKPHQNWGFKTIVRKGAPFARIGVHRPLDATGEMPRWTNGSGRQLSDSYRDDGWRSNKDTIGYDLVTLNHYATRSVDGFLVKRDRGRTNHINRDQGVEYWELHDRNDEADPRIQTIWPKVAPIRAMFAADPTLSEIHARAVRWHQDRAAELRQEPGYKDLAEWIEGGVRPEPEDIAKPVVEAPPRPPEPEPEIPPGTPLNAAGHPILIGKAAEDVYLSLQKRAERLDRLPPLQEAQASDRITLVTSMRNEAPFILEWIAYHRSIGVTDFLVYTNDCEDQTNAILDRLAVLGVVHREDNPFKADKGQRPQRGALNDAVKHPMVRHSDWYGVLDVDEFINVHVGDGTLADLIQRMGDPNVISMTWKFFGNGGVHAFEDDWVTQQFTRAAPHFLPKPRLGWGFKSLVHTDAPFDKIGVHRPLEMDAKRRDDVRWVNGSGRIMPDDLIDGNGWRSTKRTIGYDMVTLNHYVLRSADSYLVKRERGRINHVEEDQGAEYWARRNYSTEEDTSIHRHLPRAKAVLAELLQDKTLATLHAEAVTWHKARVASLKEDPDYNALYARITDPDQEDAVYIEKAQAAAE